MDENTETDYDIVKKKIGELYINKKEEKSDVRVKERQNIFLDLDQSIISGEVMKEEYDEDEEEEEDIYDIESNKAKAVNFNFQNMENYYVIFERPGLQKFLDYLFANFNVSVWTAASKEYALFIIEKIVLAGRPDRKLDYVFFSYHCKASQKLKNGSKDLSMLWDVYKLPGYNKSNTYILDDYDEVYNTQPDNTLIAKPFYFTDERSEHDDFLPNLITKLKEYRKNMEKGEIGHVVKNINES